MTTSLSFTSTPQTKLDVFQNKTPADYPSQGLLVYQFDLFVEGYAGSVVKIFRAGTTDLMPCYSDIGLTKEISNPQVLLTKTDDAGVTYGKFLQSIYVPFPYELQINDEDQSGRVFLPLLTLDGKDASYAYVRTQNSTKPRTLRERAADTIHLLDFGDISDSRATNTETLVAAIAAAAANGGGNVLLPAGTIFFTSLNLPAGVVLVGEGRDVTALSSESSGKVITVSGDYAGLSSLTLDGIQQQNLSIGLYSKAKTHLRLKDVVIKRFETNIHHQGGTDHLYENFQTRDAKYGARFIGDEDFTGVGGGSEFSGLSWIGGGVFETTNTGIEFSMRDLPVRHNVVSNINIEDNLGTSGAVLVYGARHTTFINPYFDNNEVNIKVQDNVDTRLADRNVVGLYFKGGQIDTGEVQFDGLCQDIIFEEMQISSATFVANVPANQILLRNCVENNTTFSGDSTKIARFTTNAHGSTKGVTVDATSVVVFKTEIKPNEVVLLDIKVTAEQQNGTGKAAWNKIVAATADPVVITYDEKTAAFTVGSYVVGATSGATGIITAQTTPTGTTGTLSLCALDGVFVDNELISEGDGTGSARVNGYMAYGSAALLGSVTTVHSVGNNTGAPPSGWDCGFAVSGQELHVTVTGAASKDIVWNIDNHLSAL
jgi:hypothetical protein